MPTPWPEKILRWDRRIKAGRGREVAAELAELGSLKVPREQAAAFAAVSWRCGFPAAGIRALAPMVHPERRIRAVPIPAELAEYAACLIRLGALTEAEHLLDRIDEKTFPKTVLYRGFLRIARWDYGGAVPFLNRYLETKGLSRYDALVTRINLASALVYEGDSARATGLLAELVGECRDQRFDFALGRVLQLTAENCLAARRWDEARGFLAEAATKAVDAGGNEMLLIRKFRAFVGCYENGPSSENLRALQGVRREAAEKGHWETVRQCDRVHAVLWEIPELLVHLYFGTPHQSFRERLLRLAPSGFVLPPYYDWSPSGKFESALLLDLHDADLKPGQANYRLLIALTKDFYRGFSTPQIFETLFPDEFFHPVNSRVRVRQAVHRLRRWLQSKRLPLDIGDRAGIYFLVSQAPLSLRIYSPEEPGDKAAGVLERLRLAFPWGFSAIEAAQFLGVTRRSVARALEPLLARGDLCREGRGAAVRYRFSPAQVKRRA